jgi:4-hydroxy-2-oxoglutarate aldolase
MLLEGIFAAITTPFYPDGRLYLKKLEHNIERYSRTSLAGLVVLGSTGEAVMLGDGDTRQVLRTARDAAAPEKVLLAGIARESVIETLRLAHYAAEQQYDSILVRTPSYYGPHTGPSAILTYYRALADQSPLPVVLYSIPKFTHYELPVEMVVELARHQNIIGIKDSSGDFDRIGRLASATRGIQRRKVTVTPVFAPVTSRMLQQMSQLPENFVSAASLIGEASLPISPPISAVPPTREKEVGFQILSGSAEGLLASLDNGAVGAVLAFAACAPQACQEIYTAWKDNDRRVADIKQQRIAAAAALVSGDLGVPGIKHACDLNGYYGGRPRIPLLPLDGAQQSEVARIMADLRN